MQVKHDPFRAIDPLLLPADLLQLCRHLAASGGRAWLVGGCVRDLLLGIPPHDYDVEVYGLHESALTTALQQLGRCEQVGRQFGVHKLWLHGRTIDVALPRTEVKQGEGHRAFSVQSDPFLTPEIASLRRDFTINAMMYDPIHAHLLDLHGGQSDLASRTLRHVSAAFGEDPLRPLRAMQFAARFSMRLAAETGVICRALIDEATTLPGSRIREEWMKWCHAATPSYGLRALRESGWLALYPELFALTDCPQDPRWHPEGSVWKHTLQVVDQAARIADRQGLDRHAREQLLIAALCHDMGKVDTTIRHDNGRISSPGHNLQSLTRAGSFLRRIDFPKEMEAYISPLIREHMTHMHGIASEKSVRRLAFRLQPANIELWEMLVEADASGRFPAPPSRPAQEWLQLAITMQQHHHPVRRVITGRVLIDCGIEPGPAMGALLAKAYEAQLNGDFFDIDSARTWLAREIPPEAVAPSS
ncbi:HD domain-containing protein [Mariprofundus erugo]|uniref:HD domain-containing protein n=1 Tax=Mariprofundus erugo TaxID=2528639 RepID=A0A5R9GRA8_9PROT|nr:HD domain-containing protein [Mariprofundus erugo]